jgi:osmotically-inducible protein OsmY
VVYLRGQLERPDEIEQLVVRARAVDGIKDVESLLHPPGTPAPTK